MTIQALIDQARHCDTVLGAIDAGRRLRHHVRRHPPSRQTARRMIACCGDQADGLSRLLLVRALASVPWRCVDDALVGMLEGGDAGLRGHGAWALAGRRPVLEAVPGLIRLAADGGFGTMLAQMTLESWGEIEPGAVFELLYEAFAAAEDPVRRARLAETAGLVRTPTCQSFLHRLIDDPAESGDVRAAAVRGLDDRWAALVTTSLNRARDSSHLGLREAAREALGERLPATAVAEPRGSGLRIAQIVLQGRVDSGRNGAGAGDSGGLATLVVSLGQALGKRPEIDHAFTIARAFGGPGVPSTYSRREEAMAPGATLLRAPFGPEGDLGIADMWRHRVEIERGLERLLRRLDLDGLHLRFADAGTLAASRVARRLGLPVYFTLAPDPHSLFRAAEQTGELCRSSFARSDRRQHLLFRAELVENLVDEARRLALFPRPEIESELEELLGVDVRRDPRRFQSVPEGIDLRLPERARRDLESQGSDAPVLADLRRRTAALGPSRRGLPLLVSLGRLHPVKGLHRLVEAWAGDPELQARFNLLVIGGDLEHPSKTEAEVLRRIDELLERQPRAREGLLLFGRRSNLDAARLLAAARWGLGKEIAEGGVFVCASDKEEFGLALLEAMAAGLAVVGPDSGGPATYLRDGENGFLARTTSVPELRAAIRRAADRGADPGRTARARNLVRRRFTIDTMARTLAEMYDGAGERDRLEAAA